MRNATSSAPRRARSALANLGAEVAAAHGESAEDGFDLRGERLDACAARFAQRGRELGRSRLGLCERPLGLGQRIEPRLGGIELCLRGGGALQQVLVGRGAEAALALGDPVQLGLDLVDPVGLGLEGRQESAQRRRRLAERDLRLPDLERHGVQFGRDPGDGLERGVGLRGLLRRAGAIAVRDEQLGRLGRRGGEIGHMTQPLALGLQALLVAGSEPGGALDQLGELREVRLAVRRGLGQLVPAAARRR